MTVDVKICTASMYTIGKINHQNVLAYLISMTISIDIRVGNLSIFSEILINNGAALL
jgi:hypothetical protein